MNVPHEPRAVVEVLLRHGCVQRRGGVLLLLLLKLTLLLLKLMLLLLLLLLLTGCGASS